MNNIYILIIAFTLLISCQSKEERNSFKDQNNLFSVDFQQEPIKAIDTFETEIGEIILHTFMIEESEKIAKTVTYSDYPKKVTKSKDPYEILNSAKQGAIKSLGINNIIKDDKFTENGIPGYELIGSNDLGFYIHYKLFLKENRLFQIGVLKEGESTKSKKEQDFIESFVVL